MKKRNLQGITLTFIIIVTLLTISACGKQNSNEGTTNKNTLSSDSAAEISSLEKDQDADTTAKAVVKDPFGPLSEKVTLEVFKSDPNFDMGLNQGETIINNAYVKVFGERLNIDYKFPIVMSGDAALDKMKLMIASNEILDVMIVDYDMYMQLLKLDMLEDITAAYNDYASPAVKECYKSDSGQAMEMAAKDGRLYGMPALCTINDGAPLVWLRQDWLDKLNLQGPKTLDDLNKILKAFIENDPDGNNKNDTIGLVGRDNFISLVAGTFCYDGIFDVYKAYVRHWVKGQDGTIQYGSVQPEVKNALAKLREMYAQGLLIKDFPVLKYEDAREYIVSEKSGAFFGEWWAGWSPLTDSIKNNPDADWKAYTLENTDGKFCVKQYTPIASIAVLKKGYKYPEALVKSINMYFAVQQDDPATCGGDPYNGKDPLPNWQACPVALGLWQADAVLRDHIGMQAIAEGKPIPFSVSKQNEKYYTDVAASWNKGMDWLKANPDSFGDPFSRFVGVQPIEDAQPDHIFSAYYGTTPTMLKKNSSLQKFEIQSMLSIIVGDEPLDYFDTYVKQWEDMGGREITKEVNDVLK